MIEELRRRVAAGRPLAAHGHGALRVVARALFGSWRAALAAAGQGGRQSRPAGPSTRSPLDPLFPCRVCSRRFADLATHVVAAHRLSPRRYEIAYEPLPDVKAAQRSVLRALRAYVASGAKPTAAELRRRAPELHRAVRLVGIFETVDAALAYVLG